MTFKIYGRFYLPRNKDRYVAFIQKVQWICQISKSPKKKNIPNHYPEYEIWIPKLFTVFGGKFKLQGQDSDLEYLFLEIWRFDKPIALSEKSHL